MKQFPDVPGAGMWSPIVGCSETTDACRLCVERAWSVVLIRPWMEKYRDTVLDENGRWSGEIVYVPEMLEAPFRAARRCLMNVGVASDIFHDNVQDEWRVAMFGIMARLRRHHFLIPSRWMDNAVAWLSDPSTPTKVAAEATRWDGVEGAEEALSEWPLVNVTLSTSVENQAAADEQLPKLMQAPAARYGVECSPLMGQIDLEPWAEFLDWVTVSGVYGSDGRGVVEDPAWVTEIAKFCDSHDIPMYFHGWGATFDGDRGAEALAAAMGSDLLGRRDISYSMVGGVTRRSWPGFHEV